MSEQIPDHLIWNNEKWIFILADNIYSLFDPEKFGLTPTEWTTCCYKGFVIQFRIVNDRLFLDELFVNCENKKYPPINGVKAKYCELGAVKYMNIGLELSYSGVIIIGKNLKKKFYRRAFTGPGSYETTYELEIKDGKLIGSRETSGEYFQL